MADESWENLPFQVKCHDISLRYSDFRLQCMIIVLDLVSVYYSNKDPLDASVKFCCARSTLETRLPPL